MSMEATGKKWYVYLLCDPDTKQPFYVGKGTGDRMHHHEQMLDRKIDTNLAKKEVIRKILAQDKQVLKKKVAEFTAEADAYIYEWGLINLYHGKITNIHPGGGKPRTRKKEVQPTPVENAFLFETYFLVEEVAEKIGVTPEFIIKEIDAFRLGANIIGKKDIRISPQDLRRYVNTMT